MTKDQFRTMVDDLLYLIRMRESMSSYITDQETVLWMRVLIYASLHPGWVLYARAKLGYCFDVLWRRYSHGD